MSPEQGRGERAAVQQGDRPICVMHLLASYVVGGAECVALNLARGMNGEQFDVCALALYDSGPMRERFEAAGIPTDAVMPFAERPGLEWHVVPRLASMLRKRRVDILHCHNKRAHVYGVLAARLAARRTRVVCTLHGFAGGKSGRLAGLATRLTDRGIAVCDDVLAKGVANGYLPARRSLVIHNGIDTGRFRPAADGRRQAQAPITAGCVARLSPEKGHSVLLRAVSSLAQAGTRLRLTIVGEGALRADLERQAAELGLGADVEFLGARDDVPEVIAGLDMFVLASSTEGLPLTVIEAMAGGLPVVATHVGGIPDAVVPGDTGLLVPPSDPDALAQALLNLACDPQMRRRMGERGRRRAQEQFDLRVMARRHAEVYRELVQP